MPTTSQRGFTLIELLIVIVIIGILAAIAIPKFSATKEEVHVSKMKSDLRNLATAQESYIADAATYYAGSIPSSSLVYAPSPGVTIAISEGTTSGWAASATSSGTTRTCAIFYGDAAPVSPASVEGQVACT